MLFSRTATLDDAAQLSAQRLSTRLSFFSLGFVTAAWAPLIPFAQQRLHLNHGDFGLLLLCMGIGSMLAMPATGALVQRIGCRSILGFASLLLLLVLPGLAFWNTAVMMAVSAFLFGTAAGSLGVAVNLQAVIVEKNSLRPMMSSFHGMCSLGGLAGVMIMTGLLAAGVSPLISALAISVLLLAISFIAIPSCLTEIEKDEKIEADTAEHKKSRKKLPTPVILMIGVMCSIAFLSEGAAMDWSGIYLTGKYGVSMAFAGLAYTCFAVAMTLGRFSGRFLLKKLGEKNIVTYSAICAALGLATVVVAPHWAVVLLGYALVGLGSSNIVPVLFSRVGRQNLMPKAAALSFVSTIAYTGGLAGPAVIGMIGQKIGLGTMFAVLASLLMLIAVLNRFTRVALR